MGLYPWNHPTFILQQLTLPILFEFTNMFNFLLQPRHLHISAILDLSPFPIFGLHLLMCYSARLVCVVSSPDDESAIRNVAELNGITDTQLQCVTEKQLMEILDSGIVQFDIIMAHLVDPSGELNETTFNMIPALRHEYLQTSCFNILLVVHHITDVCAAKCCIFPTLIPCSAVKIWVWLLIL